MKKKFALYSPLFTILLIAYSSICNSQNLVVSASANEIQFFHDTTAEIVSFTCKINDGASYLQWNVVNLRNSGTFIIYRSTDGKDYQFIGTKKGIGVPISKEIAYYFIDNTATNPAYYRLVYIATNNTYLSSNVLSPDNMDLATKK